MKLAHALVPLLLQACWVAAQDVPGNDRAVAFQGEWLAASLTLCFCRPGNLGQTLPLT